MLVSDEDEGVSTAVVTEFPVIHSTSIPLVVIMKYRLVAEGLVKVGMGPVQIMWR